MQALCGAASRGLLSSHRHDPAAPFTVSFSVFPALNVGDVDADIETASPVLGLRPERAGWLLVPKVLNPGRRTSSPSASASPMMARMSVCRIPCSALAHPRAGSQTVGHLRLVHVLTSRRDAVPFRHPRTAHRPVPDIDYHEFPPAATPGCTWVRPFRGRRFRRPARTTAALVPPARAAGLVTSHLTPEPRRFRSNRTPQATPPDPCPLSRPAGISSMRSVCARTPGSAPAPAAGAPLPALPSDPTGRNRSRSAQRSC